MKRTDKFVICFAGTDCNLAAPMTITKKEFERQMDYMKDRVGTPVIDDMVVEYRMYEDDYPQYTKKRHYFMAGTAETELIEIHCKPGYCIA